jgi:hypothetical protein
MLVTPIKNLMHLVTVVEQCNEELMKSNLEYDQVSATQK